MCVFTKPTFSILLILYIYIYTYMYIRAIYYIYYIMLINDVNYRIGILKLS